MSEQLLDLEATQRRLYDQVKRVNRDIPLGGAERLLLALLKKTDLSENALVAAARLCAMLDQPPEANGNGRAPA